MKSLLPTKSVLSTPAEVVVIVLDNLIEKPPIKLSNTITTTSAGVLNTDLIGNSDFTDGYSVGLIGSTDNDLTEFIGWRFEIGIKLYGVERGLFYTTPKTHEDEALLFAFGQLDLADEKRVIFGSSRSQVDTFINAPEFDVRYVAGFETGVGDIEFANTLTSKAQRSLTNGADGIRVEPALSLIHISEPTRPY